MPDDLHPCCSSILTISMVSYEISNGQDDSVCWLLVWVVYFKNLPFRTHLPFKFKIITIKIISFSCNFKSILPNPCYYNLRFWYYLIRKKDISITLHLNGHFLNLFFTVVMKKCKILLHKY